MHLIFIPLLLIALFVGIYSAGDFWNSTALSPRNFGGGILNTLRIFRQEPAPDSPILQLNDEEAK